VVRAGVVNWRCRRHGVHEVQVARSTAPGSPCFPSHPYCSPSSSQGQEGCSVEDRRRGAGMLFNTLAACTLGGCAGRRAAQAGACGIGEACACLAEGQGGGK
jgi:hypothetical protein